MAVVKIIKGSNFRGLLNYLSQKNGAEFWGGNMAGKTPAILTREFQISRELHPEVRKPVCHISISFSLSEKLPDLRTWKQLVRDYLRGMGFEGCQYCAYRHYDTAHPHLHLVVSRIDLTTGVLVNDSWDRFRSLKLMRELEHRYNLIILPQTDNRANKSPSTGEIRYQRRTGNLPPRIRIRQKVEQCMREAGDPSEFRSLLQQRGITTRLRRDERECVVGISYASGSSHFAGSQLGRDYTWQEVNNRFMCRDNAEKTSNAAEDVFDHSIQLQQISEEEARQLQNDLRHRRNRDRYERIRTELLKYYSHITHPQKFDSLIVAFATVYGISMVESLDLVRHGEGISRLKQMVEEEKFQESANAYLKTVARAAATFVKEMQYANEQER